MKILLMISALGACLAAGVLFAFSSFVMAGLQRIAPQAGMAAMQSINITVVNPVFMAVFLGTGVLAAAAVVPAFATEGSESRAYIAVAALIYVVGVLGVTFAFNVPLNNALATADPARAEDISLWHSYVSSWTSWNHVRCLAGLASAVLFLMARG